MQYCIFPGSVGTLSYARSLLETPGMLPMFNPSLSTQNRSYNQGLTVSRKFISKPLLASCLKTPEANMTATSNGELIFTLNCFGFIEVCFYMVLYHYFFIWVRIEELFDHWYKETIIRNSLFSKYGSSLCIGHGRPWKQCFWRILKTSLCTLIYKISFTRVNY